MKKIKILLFLIHTVVTIILFSVFISFRYQLKMKNDISSGALTMSWDEVSKIPLLPNVGVTTIPIKSTQALYKLLLTNQSATDMLIEGSKANPYISYSEYVLATYFLKFKMVDSAEVYAKKAFYNWPKNLNHYKLYNQILEAQKDTTEILKAYEYINERFISKDKYYLSFIDSYSNAKLRYLIFQYDDLRLINRSELIGVWKQMYEFETGEIKYLEKTINFDQRYFSSNSSKYKYKLEKDTLILSFTSSDQIVSKIPIFYSDSLQTLVLKNIPTSVIDDVPELQDQFFKKIDK